MPMPDDAPQPIPLVIPADFLAPPDRRGQNMGVVRWALENVQVSGTREQVQATSALIDRALQAIDLQLDVIEQHVRASSEAFQRAEEKRQRREEQAAQREAAKRGDVTARPAPAPTARTTAKKATKAPARAARR